MSQTVSSMSFPFTAMPPTIDASTPGGAFRTVAEAQGKPMRIDDVLQIEDGVYPWFTIEPASAGPKGVARWRELRAKQQSEVEFYQLSHTVFWNGVAVRYFEKGKNHLKFKTGFTSERKDSAKMAFALKLGFHISNEVKSAIPGTPQVSAKTQFDSEFSSKIEQEIMTRNFSIYEEECVEDKVFDKPGFRAAWQLTHVLSLARKLRNAAVLETLNEVAVGEKEIVWAPVADATPKKS